jgi:ribulose-phosphate 3-epimerase
MTHPLLVEKLKASAPQISVGVLTADWMSLGQELRLLETAGVTLLHFDVMDGAFCPMLTMGAPIVAGLETKLLKDIHLMIEEPLSKLESFVAAGADIITMHVESTRHPHRVLQALGKMTNVNDAQRGIVRGVALNPGTPLDALDPLLDEIDLVLLLAVNPGWTGQNFIPAARERLTQLRSKVGDQILICADGGITRDNIAQIAALGADIIVTGSAVFDGKAPLENARYMIGAIQ